MSLAAVELDGETALDEEVEAGASHDDLRLDGQSGRTQSDPGDRLDPGFRPCVAEVEERVDAVGQSGDGIAEIDGGGDALVEQRVHRSHSMGE
ncbi:hypothetical protein ACFJGV_05940 [Cnuibacter sp. UC19_7]|uniref:hypothetical protein n=1 Tax=Cnuibacter sp. UC19_7 TaxID=3350166 RepID=UPI00366A616A